MVSQLVENRLGVSIWKLGRLAQLLLLALSMLTFCIMLMNVGNSLFLSHVGSESLPICFTALGLFSVVAYSLLSQLVDRLSRTRLFRYMLLLSAVLAVTLRFLLNFESVPVYFALSIFAFFQFDLYANILFPNVLKDYFTTLEYKRYAPYIGIAQATGILMGGSLTVFLTQVFRTEDILLCLTAIYAISFAQLLYLENTQRRLDTIKPSAQVNIFEILKTTPDLVKRFPLSFFLASSSFLFILVYITSEFLWFSAYAQTFRDETLTSFLGVIRIASSIIQIVVLFCFTRPLLQWLGVARMNIVYPMTTLAALGAMTLNFNLKSAIALNFNGDSLSKSINTPVHQLNYNAIPPEFSGRVRALSDGIFYAVGLTLAGSLLWVSHYYLGLNQVSWIGMGLATLALLLRLPMGKLYAEGLEGMIRSNSLNLDELNVQLPAQSSSLIRELILDNDRYTQIKGLELAMSLRQPSQFLPDVEDLLQSPDADIRRALVKLFSYSPDQEAIRYFEESLFSSDLSHLRSLALEILIASDHEVDTQQLRTLLQDQDTTIQILAIVAATQMGVTANPLIRTLCEEAWPHDLPDAIALAVIRAIEFSENRDLAPLIQAILIQASPTVKREALNALVTLARAGDQDLAETVTPELNHPDPLVRAAAFDLLGATRSKGMLRLVAPGLGDSDPRVRQKVAAVLASYGQQGLSLAQDSLASTNPDVVQAAIAAIGLVRTKAASNILYAHLESDFQEVARTSRWQPQIPQNDPNWQPLAVAIADYHQRLIQTVLYVLSCLGHSRTVSTVNRILSTKDPKEFANAVEVLASLNHRRFVLPLMPVLEDLASPVQRSRIQSNRQWLRTKGYKLLLEALESSDRWIRVGALIALAMVPAALTRDPDPMVRMVARQIFFPMVQSSSAENVFMNRLLLLKNVALFKNLSLDELLLIDKSLEQQQVLAGETIFTEGSWGSHFYIIADGKIQIAKEIDGETQNLKQLSVGEYFGEMTLFDEVPHWDSAIALQDSLLLKLDKNRFISMMTQRPHILMEICRFLSQRLRETDKYRSLKKLPPPESIGSEEISLI